MRIIELVKRKQFIIPFCLVFLGTVGFAVMAWCYRTNVVAGLDETVIDLVFIIRRDWLTWAFRGITFLGSVTFIVTAALAITVVGIRKKYSGRDLLVFNLGNISGVLVMQILKMVCGRERAPALAGHCRWF